jgi:AGCS family alanine or glycine:cation symporter
MMTHYSENVLGIFFRRRNAKGEWCGGPMYYLRDGLGRMKYGKRVGAVLAVLFSCFAILASFGIGNMGQLASISESVITVVQPDNPKTVSLIVGGVIMVLAALVILGGLRRIATTNDKVVPFMALFFAAGSLIIIVMNISKVGEALAAIFRGAFSFRSMAGGAGGVMIAQAMQWGFKRGVFSNEAGLGSAPIAHATTSETDPVKQGLYGIFEVFMDTIVVCTITSLVVLLGNGVENIGYGTDIGAQLTISGFQSVFGGPLPAVVVAICLSLFALSTILSWGLYGVRCWEFLAGSKSVRIFQIFFVLFVVVGAVIKLDLAWGIADTLNGLMAIPNLMGVILLSPVVGKLTREYFRSRRQGNLR